jgi:predicted DNA-binding protein with PD1-like motif
MASGGTIKRLVAARMSPGEDVLLGLEKICKDNHINNGYIVSGMGSLAKVAFFDPVALPDKKAGYGYSTPILMDGPIELLSLTGMICHDSTGKTLLHVHYALSDQKGNAFGGHVIEGNKVLLTTDVIIGEIDGLEMGREFDKDLDVFIFAPKQK